MSYGEYPSKVISGEKSLSKGSSVVKTRLVEIEGIRDGQCYEKIAYNRIREFLNIKTWKRICLENLPLSEVREENNYLTFQYPSKPKIYISKESGRVYSEVANRDSRYQAYVILRVLAKYGYVEEFKRIRRRLIIPFLEETRFEGKNRE